jgi:hypothetical protein
MILPVPSVETSRGAVPQISLQSDRSADDCSRPSPLLVRHPTEDLLEELLLIEMRYHQHLAQSDLQELFENDFLESLGS